MSSDSHYIQNEPVPYMDLETIWNDRRDPHANPTSSSPRREYARGDSSSGLSTAVEGLFHKGPEDTTASYPLGDKRLYQ